MHAPQADTPKTQESFDVVEGVGDAADPGANIVDDLLASSPPEADEATVVAPSESVQ